MSNNTVSLVDCSNVFQNIHYEYSEKLIRETVTMCANIHNFDIEETINKMKSNMTTNTSTPITSIEIPKKKRGRPKKVKTDTVSNSYLTGQEDPIVQKLLNAMNKPKNSSDNDIKTIPGEKIDATPEEKIDATPKEEIIINDELRQETYIERDDDDDDEGDEGEIETTMLEYKGVEYLLSSNNDVYENIGSNEYVGKWNPESKIIVS